MPRPGEPLEKLGFLTIGSFDSAWVRHRHLQYRQRHPAAARAVRRPRRSPRPPDHDLQGPARTMFAADLVGAADEIAAMLYAHAGFRLVREVVFALTFSIAHDDYV